jgi:hypothetical protein
VRTAEGQFVRHLMKTFGKLPDDPWYENINAYLKVWLYESWLHDQELEAQKLRNQAILIGSFSNLEMAQRMIRDENPNVKATDLDETSKKVRERILEADRVGKKTRKKRKVVS